jgi:3-hydroxyacyl-[acyl-carrier-protein] dehydratase
VLPHAYPFRLVEKRGEEVRVVLSSSGHWSRGAAPPAVLALEILAQAALVQLGGAGAGGRGLLAGVDGAEFRGDLRPGDRLLARVRVAGGFGRLVKVAASLEREDGSAVASAELLLARED